MTGTPSNIIIQADGKGLIGEHMVTECTDAQAFVAPETDSILRVIVRRKATDIADTFYGSVMGVFMDIHYESDTETTVGRIPDFTTPTGAV